MIFLLALVAGFLGTVVLTIGQLIEIKLSGRASSNSPGEAAAKVFGIDFVALSEEKKTQFTYIVHFVYGTLFGLLFPILFVILPTTSLLTIGIVFFLIVWIQGFVMLKLTKIADWPWTWGLKWNALEFFFKALYSAATLFFFLWLFFQMI